MLKLEQYRKNTESKTGYVIWGNSRPDFMLRLLPFVASCKHFISGNHRFLPSLVSPPFRPDKADFFSGDLGVNFLKKIVKSSSNILKMSKISAPAAG